MGWPLTGVVTLLTIWMVRRANAAVEDAEGATTEDQRKDSDSNGKETVDE